MGEPKDIGLDDALEALRAELESAWRKAAAERLQFPIEKLTVELKVGIAKRGETRAGFRVPVIGAELGGAAGYDREALQTITLVLGPPTDQSGNPVKVATATDEVKG